MTDPSSPMTSTNKPAKIRVGLFNFSCCEDNTIMITVLMDDYFFEWQERIEWVEGRAIGKKKTNEPLDVAFIEGAIIHDEQAEKLKAIRARAKMLVAIGSCACVGKPSDMRNEFDENRKKEIAHIIDRFKYAEKVKRPDEIVTIDAKIPGCPMAEPLFLKTLNDVFVKFGHTPVEIKK